MRMMYKGEQFYWLTVIRSYQLGMPFLDIDFKQVALIVINQKKKEYCRVGCTSCRKINNLCKFEVK